MTIRKVSAVVLFVQDLNKCMMFYRDTLGIPVTFSDPVSYAFRFEDQDFAIVNIATAVGMVGEQAFGLDQAASHRVMMCADVEDVDAVYHALTAKGLEFVRPPVSKPWGYRTAYFADPEGNLWELRQSIPVEQAT